MIEVSRMSVSARIAEANAAIAGVDGSRRNLALGVEIYRAEAAAGDASALYRSAVFAAEGFARKTDWEEALDLLTHAAELGDQEAQKQMQLLADTAEAMPWPALRDRIDLQQLLTPPTFSRATPVSMVAGAQGFAPRRFAERLIELGRPLLQAATTYSASGALEVDAIRTGSSAWIGPLERDFVCAVMQERAARACGVPVANHETPSILSYEAGQQFATHFDFVSPHLLQNPDEARRGQRLFTVVTYLNEDFTAGQTYFPRLGFKYRGATGDALLFANVMSDGSPDRNTLHAGLAPESGRKWALSQWIRARPQLWR
jgi:prolyl 4-hydroxylase